MSKATVFGVVVAIVCVAAGVARGDAKSDYELIFGKEARSVLATPAKADDVAFAQKLLDAAASVPDSPSLQLLLYNKAYEFATTSGEGMDVALKTLAILERVLPSRKADWQAKRLALLRKTYTRSRGEARKPAALAYVTALVAGADADVKARRADQALPSYRKAAAIAAYAKLDNVEAIRAKITEATAAAKLAGQVKALEARLAVNANDVEARKELIVIHLVHYDSPSAAYRLATKAVGESLRANVRLALRSTRKLTTDELLLLGQWYYHALLPKGPPKARATVLLRAETYYGGYLARHTIPDAVQRQAASALKAIKDELAVLVPQRLPTMPADAVAFGKHHYKKILMRISWADAIKECDGLGGHLVTIETMAELAFIKKLAGSNRVWVGASDAAREGRWVWRTGRSVPRIRGVWTSGEPNGGSSCNYGSITSSGMYDSPSPYASVSGLICEWNH